MAELKKIANDSYLLPTANGGLTIRVREDDNKGMEPSKSTRPKGFFSPSQHYIFAGYSIEWNGEWVPVYRPDVRCTNGIIHIIDKVLISPNDIKVPVDGGLRIEHNFTLLSLTIVSSVYKILHYHLSSPTV